MPSPKDNYTGAAGGDSGAARSRGLFAAFFGLGFEHILSGFDHLAFLLGLWLVCQTLRELVTIVSGFTLAHSVTLAVAAFGWVNLPDAWIEALIATTIIYVGVENILSRGKPRGRVFLAFGFGLLHGLAFSNVLRDVLVNQAGANVVLPLFAFNCGVEAGQLVVTAVAFPLLARLRRTSITRDRVVSIGSILVAAAGVLWLGQRLLFH